MSLETPHDSLILTYNRQGLIPGPDETEEQFLERAKYCLQLNSELSQHLGLPQPINPQAGLQLLQEASEITCPLFGIQPTWIPIIFSNHKLLPWHGGCAWIFQLSKNTPVSAFFQLRKAFKHSTTYLSIYHRNELLAHETAHVGRMAFQEPKFEELIAYRTASSRFRRWLGPIVHTPAEALIFVASLLVSFFAVWASLLFVQLLPLFFLGYGLGRVTLRQHQFTRCLSILKQLYGNNADAVIFRLTDREIITMGKMTSQEILNNAQQNSSLRWKVIQMAYKIQHNTPMS